jgi:hypothetical protein
MDTTRVVLPLEFDPVEDGRARFAAQMVCTVVLSVDTVMELGAFCKEHGLVLEQVVTRRSNSMIWSTAELQTVGIFAEVDDGSPRIL